LLQLTVVLACCSQLAPGTVTVTVTVTVPAAAHRNVVSEEWGFENVPLEAVQDKVKVPPSGGEPPIVALRLTEPPFSGPTPMGFTAGQSVLVNVPVTWTMPGPESSEVLDTSKLPSPASQRGLSPPQPAIAGVTPIAAHPATTMRPESCLLRIFAPGYRTLGSPYHGATRIPITY
jgi:hypothetical protein